MGQDTSDELTRQLRIVPPPGQPAVVRYTLDDLDEAGLVTADIEAGLSPILRERLVQVRARE